jgi:hypothetical protein
MMNSLYGKTGMGEDRKLMWFNPKLADFCEHELSSVVENPNGVFTEDVKVRPSYVIPQLAAWVTALSRVRLWRLMNELLKSGHSLWYCDTDSIVTDAPIQNSQTLGELKLVCQARYGHFAAPKLYLLDFDNKSEVKAKGFGGGFGTGRLTAELYWQIVQRRAKVTIKRMTKLKEGLHRVKKGERFPIMLEGEKTVRSLDEKRIHLSNGKTIPIVLS